MESKLSLVDVAGQTGALVNIPFEAHEILRLRLSQMLINQRYKVGDFKIPIHLAMGHEALAVAAASAMTQEDRFVLSHRNLHYNLALGAKLMEVINEFLLLPKGLAGGRFGSMNLINPNKGALYSSSILGNDFGVAAGVALARKAKGEQGVTIVVTGDGAMEEGTFYETILFLQAQQLPSIVIIENNEWSLASRIEERRRSLDVANLANGVGARYMKLQGNDVDAYTAAFKSLRHDVLKTPGAAVVEVKLSTLGDWRLKTDDQPDGKFINYHAGPAPTVDLDEWPLIAADDSDPVHVLAECHGERAMRETARKMLSALEEGIR